MTLSEMLESGYIWLVYFKIKFVSQLADIFEICCVV